MSENRAVWVGVGGSYIARTHGPVLYGYFIYTRRPEDRMEWNACGGDVEKYISSRLQMYSIDRWIDHFK